MNKAYQFNAMMIITLLTGLLVGLHPMLALSSPSSETNRPIGQAIQFGITDYLTLRHFWGATLGYQRTTKDDRAWRVSLEINLGYQQEEIVSKSRTEEGNYQDMGGSKTYDDSDAYMALSFDWLRYHGDRLSVFYGWGPKVFFETFTNNDWYFSGCRNTWDHSSYENWRVGGGIGACLGVQWTATEWLALHAEYDADFVYYHRVRESKVTYGIEYIYAKHRINRIEFVSRGVRFGLSAYF